eukprot:gene20181-26199_t
MSNKRSSDDLNLVIDNNNTSQRVSNEELDQLSNNKRYKESLLGNYQDVESPNVFSEDEDDYDSDSDENDLISNKTSKSKHESKSKKNEQPAIPLLSKPARTSRRASIGGKWSYEEDVQLSNIVKVHGPKNWKQIATLLGTVRTDVQCLHRWNKVLKPGLLKGGWTEEEDNIVRAMVVEQGVNSVKWSEIANQLPGRIGKQCRERWFNHLDPLIKKGEWSENENRILYEAQKHFGNRWCEISKMLPGRTENAVKNRWNSSTMRRWLQENQLVPGPSVAIVDQQGYGIDKAIEEFTQALHQSGIIISEDTSTTLNSLLPSNIKIEVDDDVDNKSNHIKNENQSLSFVSSLPENLRPPKIETNGLGFTNNSKPDETTNSIIAMLQTLKSSPVQKQPPQSRSSTSSLVSDLDHLKSFFVVDNDSNNNQTNDSIRPSGKHRRYTPDIAEMNSNKRSVVFNNPSDNMTIDLNTINNMILEDQSNEPPSPTSKALYRVLKGLNIYYENIATNGSNETTVPLMLLPYFRYLSNSSQLNLMKQLLERFQRTSFTPRNFCLVNTPTATGGMNGVHVSNDNEHDGSLGLGLGSPMTALSNKIDPNCFEMQEGESENSNESAMGNSNQSNTSALYNNTSHSSNYARIRGKDKSKWTSTAVNASSDDVAVSAAVTVALQIATGSASSALMNVLVEGQMPSQSLNKLNVNTSSSNTSSSQQE